MAAQSRVFNSQSEWMKGKGPMSDVVISTRLRLARNLNKHSFPNNKQQKDLIVIRDKINLALKKVNYKLAKLFLEDIPLLERKSLVERHLMSLNMAEEGSGKLLAVDKDEMISIMVNEEDHLRLQVLFPGMQLTDGLRLINDLDDQLEKELEYAFSEEWGYLTSCPTNIGTGLRASVMVHLPGLKMTNKLNETLQLITRLGLTVRGLYGEGSESLGNIFQISNQISLGVTEDEIIEKMTEVIGKIIEQERQARKYLFKKQEIPLKDRILRAFGMLKYAYLITTEEALTLLSDVQLGIELGIIKEIDDTILSQLIVLIRPATLQRVIGEELTPQERDIKRAELIRKKLTGGTK